MVSIKYLLFGLLGSFYENITFNRMHEISGKTL
jgi:hypothetical protein